ncbi:MAG: hypothetical protein COB22_05670 [Cycloclasticus sp.]|nr:MAG: hypothetical protein COB22_05670 [Cycloclasticus sp.]
MGIIRRICIQYNTIAIFVGVLFLTGCGSEPEILIMNYLVLPVSSSGIGSNIESGAVDIEDLMPTSPCNYLGDYTINNKAPKIDLHGDIGQVGAVINIRAANAANLTTTNAADCGSLTDIAISIGSQTAALSHGATNVGSAEVNVNGQLFSTLNPHGFFHAELNSNSSRDYLTGQFKYFAKSSTGESVIVVGSFAGD